MTGPDTQTRVLARVYYAAWVAAVICLAAAGVAHILGGDNAAFLVKLCVENYLFLVPLAIFVFSVWMAATRQWTLALTGLVLSIVWAGAKLLG